ncbi:hypothetical protein MMC07_008340, partial [Pseudocyphellaria aurata]|nr:hypothetical protein [Pseudocyphellaria aurata]
MGPQDVKMTPLEDYKDLVKTTLYVLKDAQDKNLKKVAQEYGGLVSSAHIWVNNVEAAVPFQIVETYCTYLPRDSTYFSVTPTLEKRHIGDTAIQLTQLCAKLIASRGFTVLGDWLYKRVEGSSNSWEKAEKLRDWLKKLWNNTMSQKYLDMLRKHAGWLLSQGNLEKGSMVHFDLFPTLQVTEFVIEFRDGFYYYHTGRFEKRGENPDEKEINCVLFVDEIFHHMKPPVNDLFLLSCSLCTREEDRVSNTNHALTA